MQTGASFNSKIISGVSFSMFQSITFKSNPHVATKLDFIILSLLSLLVNGSFKSYVYSILLRSQIMTTPSLPPVAIKYPHGLNLTAQTGS